MFILAAIEVVVTMLYFFKDWFKEHLKNPKTVGSHHVRRAKLTRRLNVCVLNIYLTDIFTEMIWKKEHLVSPTKIWSQGIHFIKIYLPRLSYACLHKLVLICSSERFSFCNQNEQFSFDSFFDNSKRGIEFSRK